MLLLVVAGYSAEAVRFYCRFTWAGVPVVGIFYACNPLVYLSESTFLVSVDGLHQQNDDGTGYLTNDDVGCLTIRNQSLTFFPEEIDYFFKNLRIIDVSGDNNILSINGKDLQPFPQLEHFGMNGNNFTSLDGNLFSFNKRLKSIDLDNNRIRHIGEDLVTNLTLLQTLSLKNNYCVNKTVNTRAEVRELAPQLYDLCPPLDVQTTTELPTEQCPCDDKIEELREENQQLREENQQQNEKMVQQDFKIEQLQQSIEKLFEINASMQQKLREVELT